MVRHIVMWKFREGTEKEAETFMTRLAALEGEIDCIRSMQILKSAVKGGEYDAVLLADFDTLEDIPRYRVDPRHQAVAELCAAICVDRSAIDVTLP